MSFGFSPSDAVSFGQLAWKTVQNSRKACGEHDELTREVSSLDVVIRRLEKEVSKPESPINRPGDRCKEELQAIVGGCEKVLKLLNRVLEKYNTLSEKERSVKKLWQKVRFGNGELADIRDLREKVTYYTSALSLFVNMVSMGSMGRVEQKMETAGEDIREIRIAVNGITAHLLSATNREGSVLTTYADDDKAVWKEFRKELIGEGFSSTVIRKHKRLIKTYIKELGDRGMLDDEDHHDAKGSSGWADARTDGLESAFSELRSTPKSTFIKISKVESRSSGNDPFKATKIGVDPPLNDASVTCSYSDNSLAFAKWSHVDPAGCKEIVFSSYGCAEIPCNNSDCFVVQYKPLFLIAGWLDTQDAHLLSAHFRARFQVLVECLPYIWIFRAREDIDRVSIRVERSTSIWKDWRLVKNLLYGAFDLLKRFYHLDMFFLGQDRLSSTKLEESMNSEWKLELGEPLDAGWLSHQKEFPVTQWIHQFDTQIGAIPARTTNAWVKAAEMIQNSDYNGTRSLALFFTEDMSGSESRAQKS